jgi:hypothetical protein
MLPTKFRLIWPSGFGGEDFKKLANQKQEFPVTFISSPCQRQCELLPSLGVRRPLTFHILIFSSETSQPNEVKLGRKQVNGRRTPSDGKSSRYLWQGELKKLSFIFP